MQKNEYSHRRAEFDWLRVLAFGLLIFFHAAVAFLPRGLPMIQNEESSVVLTLFVAFLHEFRLALLFLVSGVGVSFALRRRSRLDFFADRFRRLVIPLLFGVLVVVPPMVFLEMRHLDRFAGSFLEFYPAVFTHGTYPRGYLSWHHYWFVAYLFLFCVLGWPVFARLRSVTGSKWLQAQTSRLQYGAGIYWGIVPLALVEVALRGLFPGFRDLIHDWASFTQWFFVFVAGFVLAAQPAVLARAVQLRTRSLAAAITTSSLLFILLWSPELGRFDVHSDGGVSLSRYVGLCLLRAANVWFWLLACVGYAGRYFTRSGRVLTYLNEAVYPVFCVHLTIMVALEYWIVPLDWSIAAKYLTISVGTLAAALLLYELCLRRVAWLRPLVGLKPGTPETVTARASRPVSGPSSR